MTYQTSFSSLINRIENNFSYLKTRLDNASGLTVDSALSSSSENPVQNKVINSALANLDKIFVAIYGVTTYADILTAYNAGKMLFVYERGLNYYVPLFRYNDISSPNRFWFSTCVSNVSINFICENNGTIEWTMTQIDMVDTDLSNLSATGKKVICGPWTSSKANVFSSQSLTNSSGTALTKTVTLPNDDCVYNVLMTGYVKTGTSSGNNLAILVKTNVISSDWTSVCGAITRSSSYVGGRGNIIIPMKYGTNNLTINRASTYNGTAELDVIGYWRMGTNSDT